MIETIADNHDDYLPTVKTSWEGLECYNYSPLVYAYECDKIAITGSGMLQPKIDRCRVWFKRPQPHMNALVELHEKAVEGVSVEEHQMTIGENNLRPHLIHFNRCENVLLDGFKIRESSFWTIHLYMCNSGVVQNIYMHDCTAPQSVHRFIFIKTNHRRGGLVENIYMDNLKSGKTQRVLEIDTDVLYQ